MVPITGGKTVLLTQKSSLIVGNLAKLLGLIMNALFNVLSSIGIENIAVCIIIFTVFVRLCMYPLSIKQQRSSKIQQFLQPEFNKITKKYRGKKDQASLMKQQSETRELQEKYGIKMTAGCLTSLIQLPIFFSLYYVIQNIPAYVSKVRDLYDPIANDIFKSDGYFDKISQFIKDNSITLTLKNNDVNSVVDVLSRCTGDKMNELLGLFGLNAANYDIAKIDSINSFILGINMTEAPGWKLTWALIIPIASFIFQYLSMKIMPSNESADPQAQQQAQTMKTMMKVMPLFSLFITITVPAGVGLYWATGALISFLTTYFTNLYYSKCDMQKIVDREMEKAAKKIEKRKASGKKTFMERITEATSGQDAAKEQAENSEGMEKFSSARLKNYTSNTSVNNSNSNAKYKAGSIASKANALKQYNEKGGKE